MTMLRAILRSTHNALLVACILLLLCSFQRLFNYDTEATLAPGLQVDNFVFLRGIPAWEHTWEAKNPVSAGLFKFSPFSYSNNLLWKTTSRLSTNYLQEQHEPPHRWEEESYYNDVPATASSIVETQTAYNRQVRQQKKRQREKSIAAEQLVQEQPHDKVKSKDQKSEPAETMEASMPDIGFAIQVPACDKSAVLKWRRHWNEQVVDRPFLFYALLGPTVDAKCIEQLQSEFQPCNSNSSLTEEIIVFRAIQNPMAALALQTCQNHGEVLQKIFGVQELVYYDASKAVGRVRSSATMRLIQQTTTNTTTESSSVFRCAGEPTRPAFCGDGVIDCPWGFQYVPPEATEDTGTPAISSPGELLETMYS